MTSSPSSRFGRSGFTLIELLAVMAIVAMMMGLSIVGFQSVSRGASMRGSLAAVRSTLGLARQHAITNLKDTYVVFLDQNTGYGNIERLKPMANRGYAVFEVDPDIPTLGGTFITEWRELPTGVIFDRTNPNSANVFNASRTLANVPVLRDGGNFGSVNASEYEFRTMHAIGFRPTGKAVHNGYHLYLVEGTVDVVPGQPVPEVLTTGEIAVNLYVNALTGIVRIFNAAY